MKKIIPVIYVVFLWAAWYFCYRHYLIWLEGFSFFSNIPDFTEIHLLLPQELFRYVGAFLLQFYAHPVAGAAIQAVMPVISALCIWAVLKRMFKDADGLMWIAFLPVPFMVSCQMSDMTLLRSVAILSAVSLLLMAVFLVTAVFGKPLTRLPGFLRNRYLSLVMLLVSLIASISIITRYGSLSGYHEQVARLEYLGEQGEWDRILEEVSYQDAMKNEYCRKYALLALSQTGRLPDYAFRYGLSSSQDFLFQGQQEPFCLGFNVLFYRSIGMNNPAVYNSYQQAVQSLPGLSFDVVRGLADIYLEQKDYTLAKKYMDILSHSTCHGRWLRERIPMLESIKDSEPEYKCSGEPFVMESFLPDISSMVDRNKYNQKFADYLLCGVLADKDGNAFYNIFNIIAMTLYPDGKNIPRLYQEALLLIASKEPSLLDRYVIDEEVWKRFTDFTEMMSKGKVAQAKRKYADTYWSYIY